ncbi:MAG: glycosyltransferase, partial [Planctomycetota bacterium]
LHFVVAAVVWAVCLRRPASARLVLLVAVLVRLPFCFVDYHSNDLYRYLWEGRIQRAGQNPYAHAPSDPALEHLRDADHAKVNHPEYPTIYPPLAQVFFRSAAGLSPTGLRNLVLLLDVAVVALLLLWLRATGRPPGHAIVYAWAPLAVASAVVGHVDPLMLLFLVGGAWAWEARRPYTAAALLGGAILAKTVAVLAVPWLLWRRPRTLPALLLVVGLGYLPYWTPGVFDTLYAFGAEFAFNGSLFQVFSWLSPEGAHLVVALLLALWVGIVTLSQPRLANALVLLFAGLLLLAPTVHFWYLTWFLVLLPGVGPRRFAVPLLVWAVSVALSSETYRAHYLDQAPFAERFGLTALEYALPFLCAIWLAWRTWPRRTPLAPVSADASHRGRFSVVIPCRGEAESLRTLLPRWLQTDAERIIVADTPTGDGTEALTRGSPRLVYLPVAQRGYGAAVRAGLAELAGDVDFAIVCDADHGRGPDQARALLAPFRDPAIGLVTAARVGARLSLPQRLGNGLAAFLIALGWGRRFHDLGPFRALRLAAWPAGALTDAGFGWNVEMNVRALELGLGVVEVGLPASARTHGEDRISGTLTGVLGAGYGILRQLYRLRQEQSCRRPSSS